MNGWRQDAEALYFGSGKTITEISKQLGVSVRSISAYLNGLPHYAAEVERRKENNKNRAAYFREHKRKSRAMNFTACAASMKKQHITDVKILSRERFFNE